MIEKFCTWCLANLCYQCQNPDTTNPDDPTCCCKGSHGRYGILTEGKTASNSEAVREATGEGTFISEEEKVAKRSVGRPRQDVISVESGRRRAGLIAKIPKDYICEWARLEYAGGGAVPIVGCDGQVAAALHHGPDKSTLNNEVGINLHRICHTCHNRWHELNDDSYGERPADNGTYLPIVDFLPHNRMDQVGRDIVAKSEIWWATPKLERKKAYRDW